MSQKTDKMLKLALVFFISLLSFSIGTFVGKKYSDNQHKLSLLEPQKNSDTALGHDFATNSPDGKTEAASIVKTGADKPLTDNEVAKIAEEFATDTTDTSDSEMDSSAVKPIPVSELDAKDIKELNVAKAGSTKSKMTQVTTAATVAAAKPTGPVAAAPQATKKPIANAAEIHLAIEKIKKMETREVASVQSENRYTVQVSSFPTQAEADKLSHDLVNKGYKSSSVSAQVNGQTWYRVQVGLFGTVKEAQDYKKDFLEKTKLSSAIVQRVQK